MRLQVLLSLRCFVSDLLALPAPAQGSVCAALRLCAADKAAAESCATYCGHIYIIRTSLSHLVTLCCLPCVPRYLVVEKSCTAKAIGSATPRLASTHTQ